MRAICITFLLIIGTSTTSYNNIKQESIITDSVELDYNSIIDKTNELDSLLKELQKY